MAQESKAPPKPADPAMPVDQAARIAELEAQLAKMQADSAAGRPVVIPPPPPFEGKPVELFKQLAGGRLKGSARGADDAARAERDPDGVDLLAAAGERLPDPAGPMALAMAHAANGGTAGVSATWAICAMGPDALQDLLDVALGAKVSPAQIAAWLRKKYPEPKPASAQA